MPASWLSGVYLPACVVVRCHTDLPACCAAGTAPLLSCCCCCCCCLQDNAQGMRTQLEAQHDTCAPVEHGTCAPVKMRLLDPCKDGAELGCSHAAAMREEAKALCAELAMTASPAMNIINHHRQL
ncbi:hypothetical protein COO60DRAFT_462558 [Scenedesmus sp. NREL 46B-D3]|nr:hypothetical protein COO60DRAFT_462558 [Scenedesmus sp. NREL 46B-D3]